MGSLALLVSKLAVAQASPPPASSQPSFSLEVVRDDEAVSCPDSPWFSARVARHAGQAKYAGTFRVTLARRGETWRARIQRWQRNTSSPVSERVLEDRSQACAPLAEATALTIAILADDEVRAEAPRSALPAAPSPPPSDIQRGDDRHLEPKSKVWVGAGGGATAGWISPLAPGLGFNLDLETIGARFGLRLLMTTEQKFRLPPGSVFVQAWLATAFSCLRLTQGRFGSGLCATFDGGMLRASAEGFDDGRPSSRPYGGVGLEAQPSWNISDGYRISAALGVLLPFRRESFSVIDRGVAYIPPELNWRILLFSEIGAF